MARVLGCETAATARDSRSKRATASGFPATDGGTTLIATSRSRRRSRARYTSPMPPVPSGPRISYGPSRTPLCSMMGEVAAIICGSTAFGGPERRDSAGCGLHFNLYRPSAGRLVENNLTRPVNERLQLRYVPLAIRQEGKDVPPLRYKL